MGLDRVDRRTGGNAAMIPKGHSGVPIGPPAQDASHNRSWRAVKLPLEFGPQNRKARTPKLTRSRAIDRSFRRSPRPHREASSEGSA